LQYLKVNSQHFTQIQFRAIGQWLFGSFLQALAVEPGAVGAQISDEITAGGWIAPDM
jgi:hypothetical protein